MRTCETESRSGVALAAPHLADRPTAAQGAVQGLLGSGAGAGRAGPEAGAPKLVVLIPALNEQATIGRVVEKIPRRIAGVGRVEVIVVDDGSDDLTTAHAWAAGADHVVRHPGNRGLVAAFNHGATAALARGADLVVTLDADGQHDPEAMPRLVAPIVAGTADVVVAARPLSDASQGSTIRRLGNRIGSRIAGRLLGVELSDFTSGYRAFSREALMQLHVTGGFTYTLETLIQAARKRLRLVEISAPARPRAVGTSRMTHSVIRYIARTGGQAFRTLLHSSPLKLFCRLSAVCAVGAGATTIWFLVSYASGGLHLPILLAAVLLTISSAALVICGLLADGISSNRRLLEDALRRIKHIEAAEQAVIGGPPLLEPTRSLR